MTAGIFLVQESIGQDVCFLFLPDPVPLPPPLLKCKPVPTLARPIHFRPIPSLAMSMSG